MMRQRIGQAIQADGPDFDCDIRPGTVATVTGWVVVAEWMDSEGVKWLSKNSGDAGGDTLTLWQMKGMLHEALLGDWEQEQPEDE